MALVGNSLEAQEKKGVVGGVASPSVGLLGLVVEVFGDLEAFEVSHGLGAHGSCRRGLTSRTRFW